MRRELILKAVTLFYTTEPMQSMDPSNPEFTSLYDKECELFSLMGKMTPAELKVYSQLVNYKSIIENAEIAELVEEDRVYEAKQAAYDLQSEMYQNF
jgi:hypothetical protein